MVRNRLSTRDFRVLRVTESLTQTEEAPSSTALQKFATLPQSPAQSFHRQSTSKFSDTASCPLENLARSKFLEVGKTKATPNPHGPALLQARAPKENIGPLWLTY